ncbi:MAG TPA: NAD(+) synthase [Sandaracinaceae bacterium LLY-WYZ-13_1]|nr:NAD(+) synthase [Sandaracinaceae bacterium LLY-WYZ-13_1]
MRGFARVSVAVPSVRVGDVDGNARHTLELLQRSHASGDSLVVFPELGLCGYTARDLLLDHHLLARCEAALGTLLEASLSLSTLAVVGLPLRVGGGVFNAAVAFQRGRLLGVVPKAYLPSYREFEERRWFRPGTEVEPGARATLLGQPVPFGLDLLFEAEDRPDLTVGLEICEDTWVQVPPSSLQVSAGATVVANLSASNFTIGKAGLRRLLARSASDRGKCAYLYVAAGPGESSTDLAFDADAFVCENGSVLVESERFARESQLVTTDVDLEMLVRERMVTTTFGDCAREHARPFRRVPFTAGEEVTELKRPVNPHPFIPTDPETLSRRCWEIFEIQSHALATRMRALGRPKLVLGVSGGLDSTMAALVAAAALDLEEQPRADLVCATMPGLGTTSGTRDNATRLVEALGATFLDIPISEVSRDVLASVDHPAADGADTVDALLERLGEDPALGDVTLENVQARLRTLVLMTLANQHGGLVVGTGDLSEKALGWATYAGDHIAMYDVNASVPKTLIRFVIRWVANEGAKSWGDPEALREVLFGILDTPISPELLPASEDGAIAQITEEAIGPYELHDFFLYHLVRHGARPGRILDLAQVAFADRYDLPALKRWLTVFYRRFFSNQFKRSCTADAPKVGMVALSPRGDWRMPSDAAVHAWVDAVERY